MSIIAVMVNFGLRGIMLCYANHQWFDAAVQGTRRASGL